MPSTSAHAPAKVILVGEHSVLYGHPAVALPFPPLLATGRVEPLKVGIHLRSERYPDLLARLGDEIPPVLQSVAMAVQGALEALERTGCARRAFEMVLSSDIPPGAGLGSSAAIAVAAIKATFAFHGREIPLPMLRMLATKAEAWAHGSSSGLDPTTVAAAGPIRFVRDHAPVSLRVSEPFGLVVADSGNSCATSMMIEAVKARIMAHQAATSDLAALGGLAERVAEALERAEYQQLGSLMNEAQGHLNALGLSTPRLDAILHAANQAGAFGAKLSGAGGGGCAIALTPLDKLGVVAQAMAQAGAVHVWPTQYMIEGDKLS